MAVVYAASCNRESVLRAINLASDGDIVRVPQGMSLWSASIPLSPAKKVHIRGAGRLNSQLTRSGTFFTPETGAVWANGMKLSGFAMHQIASAGATSISIRGQGWSVGEITLMNYGSGKGLLVNAGAAGVTTPPQGVIYKCLAKETRTLYEGARASGAFYEISEWWNTDLGLGAFNNVLYVEDCMLWNRRLTTGNVLDMNRAGRYVLRHSYVTTTVEAHSLQSYVERGSRSWEIYNNILDRRDLPGIFGMFFIRGGTGVIFNNEIKGPVTFKRIGVDNVRSNIGDVDGGHLWDGNLETDGSGTHTGTTHSTVLTDSSANWEVDALVDVAHVYNETDGSKGKVNANTETTITVLALEGGVSNEWKNGDVYRVTNGWWARDQIGRGKDEWLWTEQDPYPTQTSDPAYVWGNFDETQTIQITANSLHIKPNRDYYNAVDNFDGTVGMGVGLLSARPATCTPGVAYWATDESKLYRCYTENVWAEYYTPYPYPHPLAAPSLLTSVGNVKMPIESGWRSPCR